MATPDQGVVISNTQMYQEVRDLAKAVGRIEAKIDGVLNETRDIRADLADHEARIRSLERGRWPLPTIAALAGAIGAGTGLVSMLTR